MQLHQSCDHRKRSLLPRSTTVSMASLIPGFIKRPVKDIRNYFFGRIQHELEEGLLAAQTALRIAKVYQPPVHRANNAAD